MSATAQGILPKYRVERLNDLAGKHDKCEYFVLDVVHDPHARAAMTAYAASCRGEYQKLAAELDQRVADAASGPGAAS